MKKSTITTIYALIFLQLCFPIASALSNPDYIIDIGPGYYWSLKFDLTTNHEITIQFEVISGANKDINIYILDDENYEKFVQGHGFASLRYYDRVISGTILFTPEKNGKYWFVFSNTFSFITTKRVEIKYSSRYFGVTGGVNLVPLIIGITLISIAIITTTIVVVVKKSKKRQQIDIMRNAIDKEIWLCSNCGREVKGEAIFCEFCGNKQ